MSMPLFRIACIPFTVNVALNFRSTALFASWATLCSLSLLADYINTLLLRRRHRNTTPQIADLS
jgi:hypothetical protein